MRPSLLDPSDGLILKREQPAGDSPTAGGYNGEVGRGFPVRVSEGRCSISSASVDIPATKPPAERLTPPLPVQRLRTRSGRPADDGARPAGAAHRSRVGRIAVGSIRPARRSMSRVLLRMAREVRRQARSDPVRTSTRTDGRPIFRAVQLMTSATSPLARRARTDPSVTGRDALSGAGGSTRRRRIWSTRLGADVTKWRWGDLHVACSSIPLSGGENRSIVC